RGDREAEGAALEMPCGREFTAGSSPALSAGLPADVTQEVVPSAFVFPSSPQNFPVEPFCVGRILRGLDAALLRVRSKPRGGGRVMDTPQGRKPGKKARIDHVCEREG